ncbi:hypothetical protein AUK40_05755 [Candidatus Wirthbacteria bacterium CG2_30_54_11]|uniref:Uncharacterized protein n=1 Tax=Candidatus Wirthbacteria bacterium CG2_30_54_11 TaxID=1817892 RepID=A0A1J5IGD5_9BACT|nr:MAG: hypothetical protein AUK40_05755 [Candidatus Wirthbacteria bacterium CG2_30_54_11]
MPENAIRQHQMNFRNAIINMTNAQVLLEEARESITEAQQIVHDKLELIRLAQEEDHSAEAIAALKTETRELLREYIELVQLIRDHTDHIEKGFFDAIEVLQIDTLLKEMEELPTQKGATDDTH